MSEGPPGDFNFGGAFNTGGQAASATGGLAPFGTGGTTGGSVSTGGTVAATGGSKASGGSFTSTGGSGGGSKSTGGSGGTKVGSTGGSGSSTGGRSGFGTGGRSGGGTSGSGSGGKASGGGAAVAFSMVGSIVQQRCSTCHGFTMPLLQNNAMLRNTLLMTSVMECGGNPLVTPNDPSKSALLMLVNRQCGMLVMPAGCGMTPCIPAAEVTTLTNWINSGAPP